jgi:hypothetical protein
MGINNPFLCANPATPISGQPSGNCVSGALDPDLHNPVFIFYTPYLGGGDSGTGGGFCSPSRALSLA